MAIVSILMSVGLPSFQSIITDTRLTSTANAMLSAYQLARFEAIKQHKDVYISTSDNWVTWKVSYTDTSVTPNVIKTVEAFTKSTGVVITKYGNVGGYDAGARVIDANGSSASCDVSNTIPPTCGFTFANSDGTNTRTLNVMTTGRTKVSTP